MRTLVGASEPDDWGSFVRGHYDFDLMEREVKLLDEIDSLTEQYRSLNERKIK